MPPDMITLKLTREQLEAVCSALVLAQLHVRDRHIPAADTYDFAGVYLAVRNQDPYE